MIISIFSHIGLQSVLDISKKLCLQRYENPICRNNGYLDYINKLKSRSGLSQSDLGMYKGKDIFFYH